MPRIQFKSFRPGAIFDSFLGVLDIKSGAQIILLFAVLNKVAGVYGLVSAFFGGSITQLSFYLYSAGTLAVLIWGIRAVQEEATSKVLTLARLYALDHIVQTLYTLRFAHYYWAEIKHDGARQAHSQAQQDLIDLAIRRGEIDPHVGDNVAEIALGLWEKEKGFAAMVLVLAWLLKIYFILVIYSYAAHLVSNTYHALPLSSSDPSPSRLSTVDQYASTAPVRATNPPYKTDLGTGRKAVQVPETHAEEEEFAWDSDEEAGGEKTKMLQ